MPCPVEQHDRSGKLFSHRFGRTLLIIVLAILLFVVLKPVKIYSSNREDLHKRVILAASELDYPPFAIVRDGEPAGFSVDILKAVMRVMDLEVEISVGPWHEIKEKLKSGEIEVLPLVALSDERLEYLDFTTPYLLMHGAIFVRQGYHGISDLKDLRDKEVAVMRDDSAHEYLIENDLGGNLILTDTYTEALRALADGKHDAVVAQRLMGLQLIKQLGLTNVDIVPGLMHGEERSLKPFDNQVPIFGQKFCLAVKKGDSVLLRHLNEGLAIIAANGVYEELYNKWFGPILLPAVSLGKVMRYLFLITGPIFFLVGILGLWLMRREIDRKTRSLQREIEQRQQTEEALQDSLQSLAMAQQVARVGSWDWKVKENILWWSAETFRQFGIAPSECQPSYELFQQFIHPDDREYLEGAVSQALGGGKPYKVEVRMFRRDGSEWYMQAQGTVYRDKKGGASRFVGTQRDITESRTAEKWLMLQGEIIANMSEGVYLLRVDDGIIVFTNEKFDLMFGYEHGDLIGQHVSVINAATDGDLMEVADDIMAILRQTGSWKGEVMNIRKDGEAIWCQASVSTFEHWEYGKVFVSIHTDITERKRAEQALRKSEEKNRHILSRSIDGFFVNDQQGRFFEANEAYCRMLGYSLDELQGMTIQDVEAVETPEETVAHIEKVIKDGHDRFESKHFHKDGHIVDIELSVNFDEVLGEVFFSFVRDISKRKRDQANLQKSEELYRLIAENSVDAIWQFSLDGTLDFINAAGASMYGYGVHEMENMAISSLLSEKSLAKGKGLIGRVLDGQEVRGQIYMKHKKGHEFPISFTLAPIKKQGNIVGGTGIGHDITEKIREEEEELRKSLLEKESLLKEIHHRVKNNLQIISSLLFLQGQKSEIPEVHAAINDSQNRVRAMALIHEKLYSRDNLAEIDLGDYIKTLVGHLADTMGRPEGQIVVDVGTVDVRLSIDTAIPCGLIINELVTNSLKYAFSDDGLATVNVSLRLLADGRISVIVVDDGPGLPSEFNGKSSKTLGLGLVDSLRGQLNATLDFRNENGLVCELVFAAN